MTALQTLVRHLGNHAHSIKNVPRWRRRADASSLRQTAKKSAPAGLRDARDTGAARRARAALAGLRLAAINLPGVLKITQLAIRLPVVTQA